MCSSVVDNLLNIHKALDYISNTSSKTAITEDKHMSCGCTVSETKHSTFLRKIII